MTRSDGPWPLAHRSTYGQENYRLDARVLNGKDYLMEAFTLHIQVLVQLN